MLAACLAIVLLVKQSRYVQLLKRYAMMHTPVLQAAAGTEVFTLCPKNVNCFRLEM